MVVYICQCYFLSSSHLLLPPLCPHAHSLHLHLYSCPADTFISTIFLDSVIYVLIQFFFCFWFTSFCIAYFKFIHLTRTASHSFLFMAEWYSIVYMCHNFFTHLSIDGHLGCFHVLAIGNSAAMNIGGTLSFSVMIFSGYMPSSGITQSCDSFIPSF